MPFIAISRQFKMIIVLLLSILVPTSLGSLLDLSNEYEATEEEMEIVGPNDSVFLISFLFINRNLTSMTKVEAFLIVHTLIWVIIWEYLSIIPVFDSTINDLIVDYPSLRCSSAAELITFKREYSEFIADSAQLQEEVRFYELAWNNTLHPTRSFATQFLHSRRRTFSEAPYLISGLPLTNCGWTLRFLWFSSRDCQRIRDCIYRNPYPFRFSPAFPLATKCCRKSWWLCWSSQMRNSSNYRKRIRYTYKMYVYSFIHPFVYYVHIIRRVAKCRKGCNWFFRMLYKMRILGLKYTLYISASWVYDAQTCRILSTKNKQGKESRIQGAQIDKGTDKGRSCESYLLLKRWAISRIGIGLSVGICWSIRWTYRSEMTSLLFKNTLLIK